MILALVVASALSAQAPAGASNMGDGAIAESLVVLTTLRANVVKHYKDAPAWYRQGMIAWSLYERCRHAPPARGLDCTRPRLLADSSFLIATEIDTANVTYALTLSRYLLASEGTFHRGSPYLDRLFHTALDKVQRNGDSAAYAHALLDAGDLHWLRYDATAHRAWESATMDEVSKRAVQLVNGFNPRGGDTRDWPAGSALMRRARNELDAKLANHAAGFSGEIDYTRAEYLFRGALAHAPADVRAFRHLARLFAERDRWSELDALARSRIAATPSDGWGWMALALANHRSGRWQPAKVQFDSAVALLSRDDIARLDRVERVLGTFDRAYVDTASAEKRDEFERTFWLRTTPLWSRPAIPPRVEFLARVTYAELVWSSDELSEHGVESDRGDVYVRNGPPDRVYSGNRARSGFITYEHAFDCGNYAHPARFDYGVIVWGYDVANCDYKFDRVPRYRTFAETKSDLRRGNAASWANLTHERVDTMPTQLARFRAVADSVDVYLATRPPVNRIHTIAEVKGPVRQDYWLMTHDAAPIVRDSVVPAADALKSFTHRVAQGRYFVRTEASADASLIASRATIDFVAGPDDATGFTTSGFGLSDIVYASSVRERSGAPRRWTDVDFTPMFGTPHAKSTFAMVWETYALANDNGNARYTVTATLRPLRLPEGWTATLAAKLGGVISGAAGARRVDDREVVQFSYDRVVPHAPALVDYITITVGELPRGDYLLAVEVTDKVTGKRTGRSQVIRP